MRKKRHPAFASVLSFSVKSCFALHVLVMVGGCSAPDYGEGNMCFCTEFVGPFDEVAHGTPITDIQVSTSQLSRLCPGKIIAVTAGGGEDLDFRFDEAVEPLDGCGGGCAPSEECEDEWGSPERTCVVAVSNKNARYRWAARGYIRQIYPDPESPNQAACFIEAKVGYTEEPASFELNVVRFGASQLEEVGLNLAATSFEGQVLPAPQYTMSIVTNPGAALLVLSGPDEEASETLREDRAQYFILPQDNLRNRLRDVRDNHVCVDYRVASQATASACPICYDEMNPVHISIVLTFNAAGYDIMICDHLYNRNSRPPPPPPPIVYGLAYSGLDFMLFAAKDMGGYTKRIFAHEIGHCAGELEDDVPDLAGNIMQSHPELNLMDVHTENLGIGNGSDDWHD